MDLGICTIQRDRGRWLAEWVCFHYLVGFRKFYIYAHCCTDDSWNQLCRLQKIFDIRATRLGAEIARPQLHAYKLAYEQHGSEVDWMAFIDGDEFLFPTFGADLQLLLKFYARQDMSAVAVCWLCFGSNGHVAEPDGLIIENYSRRARESFKPNRHIKSIVRGRLGNALQVGSDPHFFQTPRGTQDELLRPVTRGYERTMVPSHGNLRINHYTCQSRDFFKNWKQNAGAADSNATRVLKDSWWRKYDRNEVVDVTIARFLPELKQLMKAVGQEA